MGDAPRTAGVAAQTNWIACLDGIAHMNKRVVQVGVGGNHPVLVLDFDQIVCPAPILAAGSDLEHDPVPRGGHHRADIHQEIVTVPVYPVMPAQGAVALVERITVSDRVRQNVGGGLPVTKDYPNL